MNEVCKIINEEGIPYEKNISDRGGLRGMCIED